MNLTEYKNSNREKPIVIAGPCSAESKEQVLAVAEGIDRHKVDYFRAGIWKPRTRPGSFEGVGNIGLGWLNEVKSKYNLPVCTEVANARHVYDALKAGIDMLWIGARTSTNPFAVQEIADSLKGVNIEVMVKNPINPDLKLWFGAVERFQLAGIETIGAIHRGFSKYGKHKYRNEPQWQIPIEFKREMPDVPMIHDPSHTGGKREYIAPLSQKALDLNFNGLMIESHCNPDEAWSDAAQQVTPDVLNSIMTGLEVPKVNPNEQAQESLTEMRSEIDEIDGQLLDILKQRMNVVEKIGLYKKANDMTILQNNRWSDIIERTSQLAVENGLDPKFVEKIIKAIHQGSINLQEKVIREN